MIAAADISEDITIAPTTFEDNPVEELPPPPDEEAADISAAPTFTPFTVRPDLTNEREVQRALEREYPPILRDAGIGGTVQVHFFIDEVGGGAENPGRADFGTRVARRGRATRRERLPVHPGAQPGQGRAGVDRDSHYLPDALVDASDGPNRTGTPPELPAGFLGVRGDGIGSMYLDRLKETLPRTLDQVEEAARRSGRSGADVTLVAVTKSHPLAAVEAALEAGIRDIGGEPSGENWPPRSRRWGTVRPRAGT